VATSFAISIPQSFADGGFDPAAFRRFMERAEALGFESAWTSEQMLGSTPMLGPIETMTWAAACTRRLRIGCAVFISPLYSPVHLAKSISTLDQLSRGRVEVGVTTGGRFRPFSAFGVEPSSFVTRFTEGLALMKALWSQPKVDFAGRFWQLEGASMEPKPFQKPAPPVWIGANHPNSLRRAVRLGDGFIGAGSSTTAQFVEHVQIVGAALAETGRDPASFRIAKRVYLGVDDDAERGRRRVEVALDDRYGLGGRLHAVAVSGPPDAVARGLREVADAGAELLLLNPLFDDDEQMERLAAEVVPQLR
jgi:alkanesulfonate monooxygenase SsuD/methylene tetrahydromethanopterin reductase-like flavin-dependent oxidoreductase (luciferase family)